MVPSGITVEGKPIEQVIKEMESIDKGKEIGRERKDTIHKQKKCRVPIYRGMKYPDRKEKNGKPYHLPACIIEREKGIMEKKTTLAQLLFDFLKVNRGTKFTLDEIVGRAQGKRGPVSAVLSDMAKIQLIHAVPEKGRNRQYFFNPSSEDIDDPNIILRKFRNQRNLKAKPMPRMKEVPASVIEELFGKVLGIKVEVSGQIQVKFVFEVKNQD